jgi:uncharacterized protein YdeI (YjbR/CyaY-like superfamily)
METVSFEDRSEWRAWLRANAKQATEVWFVDYKKDAGRTGIAYADAVEEAICCGWIDGKIKKLDEARFVRRFTPRHPKSAWSPTNIERARRMIREGKMTLGGLKVFNPRNQTPSLPTKLPAALGKQFRRQDIAWGNFIHFPPSYQRMTIGWVASARKEETQLRRMSQLIAQSAANKRINFI